MSLSTKLFQREVIAITCQDKQVVAQFGNVKFRMEFQTALELSCALRLAARQLKIIFGYDHFRRRTLGSLTDLNASPKRPQRFGRSLPERLQVKQLGVRVAGQTVYLHAGASEIGLPYETALTIAQWFRLRGKEARNAAGEGAHWSKLVNADSPRILTTGG